MPKFPLFPTVDEFAQTLMFRLKIADNLEIRCIASRGFFEYHFNANAEPQSWVEAYRANVEQIDKVVISIYRKTGISPVLLHSGDM